MQIPVLLDRSQTASLTVQLAEQLRNAIRQGRIASGTRLPSSRQLSEQLDVSRNTVVRAYEQLTMEGYVDSRPASGMFAALHSPDELTHPSEGSADSRVPFSRAVEMPMPLLTPRAPMLASQHRGRISFDFFPGRPNPALFPIKTWRRLIRTALSHGGALGLSDYGDPGGLPALRTSIAHHLAAARGVIADPAQIVIVAGIQEGINIAARLFLAPGTVAAVETPCYQGAAFAFEAAGSALASVPVDEDGLITEDLPKRPAALLYLTPSHQYPTGHTLSLARRHAAIAWARRTGCYILEDDYGGDFRYEGSPLPAIAGMAPDCAIHLGTFSTSLGAGLRLGYMVLPPHLADAARQAKMLLNGGNPWLEQAALAEMIRSGSYAAHLTRIRAHYRDNRDSLLASLRRHFGDVAISGDAGGLHVFWELPPGVPDAATLEGLARRTRVGIYALRSAAAHEPQPSALSRRGIVLGYAALTPRQIEQGIARLSDAIDETLDNEPAFLSELLVNAPISLRALARPAVVARRPHLAPQLRQRPALHPVPPRQARSWANVTREGGIGMPIVSGIYRYPIKGLSPQPLPGIVLEADKPFPFDRVFALTRPGVPIDPDKPKWAKKGLFIMLMLEEQLAQVRTHLDIETMRLTIAGNGEQLLEADLDSETDRAEVERFFQRLVSKLPVPPRLVRAHGGHFMDKPDNVMSLINLATVRSLEELWGYKIDPLRFRANFYIDGARPWQEFDWVGSDIRLGDALFRVDRRNGRCSATNVDPLTGIRDRDIPGSLRAAFGHKDLGVYLVARQGGKVVVGDPVECSDAGGRDEAKAAPGVAPPASGHRSFICRGCYFIYEEARGLPQQAIPPGTSFAAIPETWRCPDCGTDKTNFRPYQPSIAGAQPA
jgi:GntR family transcriptional regulator/MocR family aminotransferase